MVLWAACFPLIAIGLDLEPHLAFAAMRAALAGLCLLTLGVLFPRSVPRGGCSWALVALAGLGATSLGFLGCSMPSSSSRWASGPSSPTRSPLLAAVLAHTFLGERLMALGKAGLVSGLAGIAAIAWPGLASGDTQDCTLGIAYVVLAAAGVSTGNVAIKRLTGQVDAVIALGFQLLIGAAPLALLLMLTEDVSSPAWSTELVLVLVVLSVFGSSLAFWLWFAALRSSPDCQRHSLQPVSRPSRSLAVAVPSRASVSSRR